MTSTIKDIRRPWKKIGTYELAKEEQITGIDLTGYTEFLVQFGLKNNNQPYGGMTYTDVITNEHSKPSFIPYYQDDGFQGMMYVFQYGLVLTIINKNINRNVLVYLYVR